MSLREKLFGATKPLREKIASFADAVGDMMPASTYEYTRPEKPLPEDLPFNVNDGALSPKGIVSGPAPKPVAPAPLAQATATPTMSANIQPSTGGNFTLKDRGISFSLDEIDSSLKPMLYSEIAPHGTGTGQRPKEKVELEMRAIMNTVLNRSKNRKKSVKEVIYEPNQYQGVGTPKYNSFATTTDPLEKEQVDFINETMGKILAEIENGTFQDNVGGAEFYGHLKDGTLRAFDTWAEYKKAIDAGLVK